MVKVLFSFAFGLATLAGLVLSGNAQQPAYKKVIVPSVAHNELTAQPGLPDGDQFPIKPLTFTVTGPGGAVFRINATTFGNAALVDLIRGFFTDRQLWEARGFSAEGPGAMVTATEDCPWMHWDIVLKVARTGTGSSWVKIMLDGEVVAILDVHPHGAAFGFLANREYEGQTMDRALGFRDRLAHEQVHGWDLFPYTTAAGQAGAATDTVVIALPKFMNCGRLSYTIVNAADRVGKTSVVVLDQVLITKELPHDREKFVTGLFSGVQSWVATGNSCGNCPTNCPEFTIQRPDLVEVCPVCVTPYWVGPYSPSRWAFSNGSLVSILLNRDSTPVEAMTGYLLSAQNKIRLLDCNSNLSNTRYRGDCIGDTLPGYTLGDLIDESMDQSFVRDPKIASWLNEGWLKMVRR